VGLAGAILLFTLYLGIVSFAESPQHALQFLWQDRWVVIPIILVGLISGTYSSIFNATPLVVSWELGEFRNLFGLLGRGKAQEAA